jgi:ABC-2 type transport system ATP-binding protein
VDHVSFEVRRGEIVGLLGPNGAGKTTTFRMLCGLLPATSGTLCVADMDLRKARASARQRIGYVAQKFSLYGALSVTENLEFFASAYGLRGARKRDRIDWALQQFALVPLHACPVVSYPVGTSSAWQWQRRSCTSRNSSSWTSRPVVLTRSPAASSGGALRCWLSRV